MSDSVIIGQLVRSKSGRDKGRWFLVYEVLNDSYLLLVDGEHRNISNPKKKNIIHVQKTNKISHIFAEKVQNRETLQDVDVKKYLSELGVDQL